MKDTDKEVLTSSFDDSGLPVIDGYVFPIGLDKEYKTNVLSDTSDEDEREDFIQSFVGYSSEASKIVKESNNE